jgi:hypothetical protein
VAETEGYGTNHATKAPSDGSPHSQVIDEIGGRGGARTPGLIVANDALSQLSYTPTDLAT